MRKILLSCLTAAAALLVLLSYGCNKEKIVESTQYIKDTKYVELPPDTVWRVDTLVRHDSSLVFHTDTVRITVTVHDTVQIVRNFYDTIVVRDTVVKPQYIPSAATAISAMEVQTDPLIYDFAFQNFADSTGWTLYLSPALMSGSQISTGIYDIGAYAAYFNADFSGYYPLEMYWRMTYKSGDPSDAANWTMSDPPAAAPGWTPGISGSLKAASAFRLSPDKLIPVLK